VGGKDIPIERLAQAVVEGSLLAAYVYSGKPAGQDASGVESLDVWIQDKAELPDAERGVQAGLAIMAGVTLTRELVNLPPNVCTPAYLAEAASQAAEETGMRVQVLERGQMQALGMGALLAVAQGSEAAPRFIILEHNASKAGELDSIVLVGKA
jgi:leucyl aminopeptidase